MKRRVFHGWVQVGGVGHLCSAASPAQRWVISVIIVGRPWLVCPETGGDDGPGHGALFWNRFHFSQVDQLHPFW
jgi:hypothetical protein